MSDNKWEQERPEAAEPPAEREPLGETQTVESASSVSGRRFGYVVNIVVNVILIYVVTHLSDWDVPFLTNDFGAVVPPLRASMLASIVVSLVLLCYDARWMRRIGQLVQNGFAMLAVYALYQVFPFSIEVPFVEQALRIALIVSMVGIVIGSVFELVRLLTGRVD